MDKRAWIVAILGTQLPVGIAYVAIFTPLSKSLGDSFVVLCGAAEIVIPMVVTPIALSSALPRRASRGPIRLA